MLHVATAGEMKEKNISKTLKHTDILETHRSQKVDKIFSIVYLFLESRNECVQELNSNVAPFTAVP